MNMIERRKTAAYWFAVGWSEATEEADLSQEFCEFVVRETQDYVDQKAGSLSSVLDQWKRFKTLQAERTFEQSVARTPGALGTTAYLYWSGGVLAVNWVRLGGRARLVEAWATILWLTGEMQ